MTMMILGITAIVIWGLLLAGTINPNAPLDAATAMLIASSVFFLAAVLALNRGT